MKFIRALALGTTVCALAGLSGTAMAQQPPAGETPPSAATPPSATTGTSSKYSDTEVEQFTKAAIALQTIQKDTAVPAADKQTKMASAVQQSGLPPEKFNEMASASSSDPALMQRIQLAAGKMQGAAKP